MDLPTEMTAIVADPPGGPEALRPVRMALPVQASGEVLIRVAAAGLNGADLAQRGGHYDPPPGASPIIGLEVSGEIVAAAPGAGWTAGDRVAALTNGGGYAEYVAVPAGQVLPIPDGYGLIEAAALPETFFTVMQTLVMRAGLEPGMTVLVHGGAGGIGGAAILIARACGARAIAVVSSPGKAAYAEGLGAFASIDRKREDFVARTLELTGGNGAERIVDVVGGPVEAQNMEAAALFGHIVVISRQAGGTSEIPLFRLMARQLTISGSTLRPQSAAAKAAIAARLRTGIWPKLPGLPHPKVNPIPLAEAAEAHRRMEAPDHYGKTLLVTDFGASSG
jgi:NADPH2:quinone reductase